MRQMERFFFFFSQLWITIFYHCQGLCVLSVFLGGLYGVSWIIFYFVDGNYPNKENEEPSGFFSTNDKCFISFLSENFSKKKDFFLFLLFIFFFHNSITDMDPRYYWWQKKKEKKNFHLDNNNNRKICSINKLKIIFIESISKNWSFLADNQNKNRNNMTFCNAFRFEKSKNINQQIRTTTTMTRQLNRESNQKILSFINSFWPFWPNIHWEKNPREKKNK